MWLSSLISLIFGVNVAFGLSGNVCQGQGGCEAHGRTLSINCGADEIQIDSAVYAANCNQVVQTTQLGVACDGKNICSYYINAYGADIGGDPCGGVHKDYRYEYTCNPTCQDETCNDGNRCNGEEYCDSGECIQGQVLECERNFVCDAAKGCVRDCDTFAIDGYLRDCSAEFVDNEAELASIQIDISAAENSIDKNIGDIASNDGDITDLGGRLSALEDVKLDDRLITLEAAVDDLTERMDAFAPLQERTPPEARSNSQSVSVFDGFWYDYHTEVIFGLVLLNIVLMVSLCWSMYYSRKREYSRVRYYESDDREDIKLKGAK